VTADDDKISGTNVVAATGAAAQHKAVVVSDLIEKVRLYKSKLTVNGETIYDDTHVVDWSDAEPAVETTHGPSSPDPANFENVKNPRDLRFASTHFSHDSQITITLTCVFKYRRVSGSVSETEGVVATVKPKAWNRVVLWRTNVTEANLPLDAQQAGWVGASYDRAKAAFLDAHYQVSSQGIPDKSEILAELPTATAIFGLCHGSLTGITDGTGVGTGHTITWSEFKTALADRYHPPGIPPVSHFFAYACKTMPGGQSPDSFYLWREPLGEYETIVNGACYGFEDNYVFCTDENQHIETLFDTFATGTIAFQAVAEANRLAPIPRQNGTREDPNAPLKIAGGDAYTTFSHVYLAPEVRDALNDPYLYADWKWIPPTVP